MNDRRPFAALDEARRRLAETVMDRLLGNAREIFRDGAVMPGPIAEAFAKIGHALHAGEDPMEVAVVCFAAANALRSPKDAKAIRRSAEGTKEMQSRKQGGVVKDYPDGIHTDCKGLGGGVAIETFPAPEGGYCWRVVSLATWSRRRDAEESARAAQRDAAALRRVAELETERGIMRDALDAAAYVCEGVARAPARPEHVHPKYARSVAGQCRRALGTKLEEA